MSYQSVSIVHVGLHYGEGSHKVGRFALANRRIYFEYDAAFLKSGLEISSFKLPLKAGAVPC